MQIGVPKEIKTEEYRVGMTPFGVAACVGDGHRVLVEAGAGSGSGYSDEEYISAGAEIVTVEKAWAQQLVVKVKEPIESEFGYLREGLLLFTYLHLAAAPELALALLKNKVTALAYETLQAADGSLPLLTPMSAIAGRMATQAGATHLQKEHGGKGVLLGGIAGVRRSNVVILGGGIVGSNAARIAIGFGANVTILDVHHKTLSYLDDIYAGKIQTLFSTQYNIEESVLQADLLIGAVLIPGAKAPHLVDRELVRKMRSRSVIVDVSVDQGGCIETTRPTTHDKPTFIEHDVVHYGVANMPGAVPHTSTRGLTDNTLPYLREIAALGLKKAAEQTPGWLTAINTHHGAVCHPAVATTLNMQCQTPSL